jgi:hypothetical protein
MGRPMADGVRHQGTSGRRGRRPWSAAFTRMQRKLVAWRLRHPPRSRLPEALWRQVALLARGAGIARTAQTLRLDYYSVKKHVAALTAQTPVRPRTPEAPGSKSSARVCRFVEVLPDGKSTAFPAAGAAPRTSREWPPDGSDAAAVHPLVSVRSKGRPHSRLRLMCLLQQLPEFLRQPIFSTFLRRIGDGYESRFHPVGQQISGRPLRNRE